MFTYKTKLFVALTIFIGFFSLAEATTPNAPGPYVGSNKLDDTNKSVRISFQDNSNDEDGYYISLYDYESSSLVRVIDVNRTQNRYQYANITDLMCNKTYQASVVAYNQDGNSSSSNLATFNIKNTFGAICPPIVTVNAPGVYLGVTAIPGSNSSARVSFKDNSDNEDRFRIVGNYGIDVNVSSNDRNVHPYVYKNLTNLTCDQTYTIKALAYKGTTTSDFSNEKSFNLQSTFGVDCPAVITLIGSAVETVALGDYYFDPGVTAVDHVDGDLTANVVTTTDFSTLVSDNYYSIIYEVTDSNNQTSQIRRRINVIMP